MALLGYRWTWSDLVNIAGATSTARFYPFGDEAWAAAAAAGPHRKVHLRKFIFSGNNNICGFRYLVAHFLDGSSKFIIGPDDQKLYVNDAARYLQQELDTTLEDVQCIEAMLHNYHATTAYNHQVAILWRPIK